MQDWTETWPILSHREFKEPRPHTRLILDSVSVFVHNVQRSLAAGTIKKNKVAFEMCTNVFRFLFDGKGVNSYQEYMALRILMQPFSVVNGTSTSTKMGTDAR